MSISRIQCLHLDLPSRSHIHRSGLENPLHDFQLLLILRRINKQESLTNNFRTKSTTHHVPLTPAFGNDLFSILQAQSDMTRTVRNAARAIVGVEQVEVCNFALSVAIDRFGSVNVRLDEKGWTALF